MTTTQQKFLDLDVIANSGQCFRMFLVGKDTKNTTYDVLSGSRWIRMTQCNDETTINLHCAGPLWRRYFDDYTSYSEYYRIIYNSGDEFLINASNYSRGMRILRQDFWETLVSFMISQNNNIPRIKKTIEKFCERFGKPMYKYGMTRYTFPMKEELEAQVTRIEDLDALGLGYRREYLYELIKCDSSALMPEYDKLLAIKGIGPKVASCVLLYGAHDMAQFPVDTWMKKIINEVYGGHFDVTPYKGFEGFVQQIMFYYYRNNRTR